MYNYDPTNKVLRIQQIPEDYIDMAMVQYQRDSYRKFCEHTVFDYLVDFVKMIGDTINHNVTIERNPEIPEERQLPRGFYKDLAPTSKWSTEIRTLPDRYTPIMVQLNIDGARHRAEILRLPYMDEDAVLNVHGERRICQCRLTAADGISYDGVSLLGLSIPMRNIPITITKTPGATVKYRQSNVSLLDIVGLYCAYEAPNVDLMNLYCSAYLRSWIAPKAEQSYQAVASKLASKDIYKTYHSTPYALGSVARDSLNKALSLNRARNRVLSRDVIGVDGVQVARAGDVVSDNILKECRKHMVHALYVSALPDAVGYRVSNGTGMFMLNIIPLGTIIPDEIRKQLPPEFRNAPSTSRTLFFDGEGADVTGYTDPHEKHLACNPPVIYNNNPLTEDTLRILGACGYDTLNVSRSAGVYFDVTYEEAIVGNQTAQLRELMTPDQIRKSGRSGEEWVCYANNPTLAPGPAGEEDYLNVWDWLGLLGLVGYINRHPQDHGLVNKDEGMLKRILGPNEAFTRALEDVFQTVCNKCKSSWTRAANENTRLMGISLDALNIEWQKRLWNTNTIIPASFQNPTLHMQQANLIDSSGGLHEIPNDMRMLATGFYGRIDPYETPMGKRIGVSNVRATGSRIDVDTGMILTAYLPVVYDVDANGVRHCRVPTDAKPVYMTAQQEVSYIIGDKLSLKYTSDDGKYENSQVVARVPDGHGGHTIETVDSNTLQYVNYHSNQHISTATALIPFVGANEAARLTLGTGMIKQSILVQYNERPRLYTSMYHQMFEHTHTYCAYAEEDGFVVDIGSSGITIRKPRPEYNIPEGVDYDGSVMEDISDLCDDMPFHTYEIDPTLITRQGLNIINWRVREGQWVNKGDLLYDSSIAPGGIYSPGCNFFVAYIPDGYSYEDAVEVSEAAASKFTSITLETVQIHLGVKSDSAPEYDPNTRTYIPENSPIATFHLRDRGRIINKQAMSGMSSGILLDVVHNKTEHKGYSEYLAHLISFNRLRTGDKLIGRHSNKGTSSIVQKNSKMPRFKNGVAIDCILNPLGVPSRLNIGQNFEALLSFVAYLLDINIESDSFNGATKSDVAELMKFVHALANNPNPRSAVAKFTNIPISLRNRAIERHDEIRKWAGCFNPDGTADLVNPHSGKLYPVPVSFGMPYMLKLEHEVSKKLKMRAGELDGEEYTAIYQQPVEGAARGGGERVGEMELCAYMAYGANELLDETLNEDSDNVTERLYSAMEDAGRVGDVVLQDPSGYFRRDTAVPHSVEHFRYLLEALGIDMQADFLPPVDMDTAESRVIPDRRSILRNERKDEAPDTGDDLFKLFK